MGRFVNPDNSAFQVALNSEIYIDKTELLSYTNKMMDTNNALICNSRPRRFGKSITADMLTAYYSKGCDSLSMFEEKNIGSDDNFLRHLNQYNVIHFDVQWCRTSAKSASATVSYIEKNIIQELQEIYPDIISSQSNSLPDVLDIIHNKTSQKFIIIIDEWDALIRDEAENTTIQEEYINLLRGLFKGTQPTKFLHLAYLTGILPIKRIKTQSALNNFDEFTMLDASILSPYMGFTEKEVKELCKKYHIDYKEVESWYDGYLLSGIHIYNPKAVVSVMMRKDFQSYWSQTGTYESILPFIDMNFDGLKTAIIKMISGESVEVEVSSFQNDMRTFEDMNDVLTLLIHLGYLAYNKTNQTAYIPNEEIRSEFLKATKKRKWNELIELQKKSEELLKATFDMDCEFVAYTIETFHSEYTSAIAYNDENSLSCVLSIAYLSAMQYYFKPIRELPTGRGFADLVFIPKKEYPEFPVLLIELKWNKKAKTAIEQIKEKSYVQSLQAYSRNILLVGISYQKKNKIHECIIERNCEPRPGALFISAPR